MSTKPSAVPVTTDPLSLISKLELARLLRINTMTVDRWRKSPDFPAPIWLTASTPRWRRVDVEQWLASKQGAADVGR